MAGPRGCDDGASSAVGGYADQSIRTARRDRCPAGLARARADRARSAAPGSVDGSQAPAAFTPLGRLEARPAQARDDGCKASCVHWYGNARQIFVGERVFALLGYELVEGQVAGNRRSECIDERRRANFAPPAPPRDGRYSPFE